MTDHTFLSLEEASALLVGSVRYQPGAERLPLDDALGRVLAQDLRAPFDLPPFDCSPLDGYAVRAADTSGAGRQTPAILTVTATLYAGMPPSLPVGPGQAVRLMTGAPIPPGADCVIRQEDTDGGSGTVQIYVPHRPRQNFRARGSELRRDSLCLRRGERLDAVRIGVLASLGQREVQVFSRPKAALLATGDELTDVGAPLSAGKIYNSNQHLLQARLRELGCAVQVLPPCGDDAARIAAVIQAGLRSADILITTGGVSVGTHDFLPQVCGLLGGHTLFHGLALKPGSPAMAFLYGGKCVLCLSGNPFAAAATFELLARPLLEAMSGLEQSGLQRAAGVLQDPFPKASGGRRLLRAVYRQGQVFLPAGGPETHSSGSLASMAGCNCMIDIPAHSGPLTPGQAVSVILL